MTSTDREKLVEAYGQACYDEGIAVARRDSQRDREATARELNARAALLAALTEGEVLPVQNGYIDGVGHAYVCVCDLVRGLPSGQRVRVSKVEAP